MYKSLLLHEAEFFWEADSSSGGQQVPCYHLTRKFISVLKSFRIVLVISQFNPDQAFKLHITILPYTPMSPSIVIHLGFPSKYLSALFISLACYTPRWYML
jgi:hypothetical protein